MSPEQKPTTFFYLDDDSDDLSFFQEAVDEIGETVTLFEMGDDMLHSLKNPPSPSVVFLDLNMPIKNGFEILQEVRSSENFKNIPIVVYSTSNGIDTVMKCFNLGANLFITKAVSLSGLKKAITHVAQMDWDNFKPDLKSFVFKL